MLVLVSRRFQHHLHFQVQQVLLLTLLLIRHVQSLVVLGEVLPQDDDMLQHRLRHHRCSNYMHLRGSFAHHVDLQQHALGHSCGSSCSVFPFNLVWMH